MNSSEASCRGKTCRSRAVLPGRSPHDLWPLIAFNTAVFVAAAWLVASVPESLENSARTANAPVTMAAYRERAVCD
ncbi:MAG: hypothetical protein JWO70_2087 [Betaproteobacteria bacterium]|jgi:hypothetical protein|nr:hypothetical protein [Betaproteobacteria bacterium]